MCSASIYLKCRGAFWKLHMSNRRSARLEATLRQLLACRVGEELVMTVEEIEAAERVLAEGGAP